MSKSPSTSKDRSTCRSVCWLVSVALGVVGFFYAANPLGWPVFWSVLGGLAVFFVTGFVLVRLFCRSGLKAASRRKSAAEPLVTVPKTAPEMLADGKPEMLARADAGRADDLKNIKGIGPALEGLLNQMGVYHFDQVANWTAENVAWIDDNLVRFKGRASRDGWVEQAKMLTAGAVTAPLGD